MTAPKRRAFWRVATSGATNTKNPDPRDVAVEVQYDGTATLDLVNLPGTRSYGVVLTMGQLADLNQALAAALALLAKEHPIR